LLHVDEQAVCAGLLHDTVEDTWATLDDIEDTFGHDIAMLVDAVTKLSRIEGRPKDDRKAETFRKMFVAMAQDLRVILVKLADRLHNMRTLEALPATKQHRIARETIDLYAPIAGRLGIQWLKAELEDWSFRYLDPEQYHELSRRVSDVQKSSDRLIQEVIGALSHLITDTKIEARIEGRPKHLWSIYNKMQKRDVTVDQIYDLVAFRVIVPQLRDCYELLGHIHAKFTPIPGRFKDYIAMPKANRYRSLHTTVIGPTGRPIEIQIRTDEMHAIAENGVAAHWRYKEDAPRGEDSETFRWLRDLYDWHREVKDAHQFVEGVRIDLFQDEVYVFTPQGDILELPKGATVLDFAYKIHTEVGHQTTGAQINGKMAPLSAELHTGDIAEILTKKNQQPRRHWLKIVHTSGARQKIRARLNRRDRERALALGEQRLDKALRDAGENPQQWPQSLGAQRVYRELGIQGRRDLIRGLGYGRISIHKLTRHLQPQPDRQATSDGGLLPSLDRLFKRPSRTGKGILVEGMEDIDTDVARCCRPLPGDDVVGYIRVGKGIRVHKTDCPHIANAVEERLVDVSWDEHSAQSRPRAVQLRVACENTPGILAKMSKAISDQRVNIAEAAIRARDGGRAEGHFAIEVRNRKQLEAVRRELERIRGVISIERKV